MAKITINFAERYKPFPKQFLAHIAPYRYVLYGGAMNSGKTRWLCADIIRRCLDFPGSQAAIIRRNLPSLKRSTLRTFFQIIDDRLIKRFNSQDLYVEFKNGSVIFFMEANEQKDPEFYKFGGVELSFLGIDEAQEVDEKALLALAPKMRHLPRGYKHVEDLPRNFFRVNLTANPAPGWIKEKFVDTKNNPESIYIPATVFDNPYADKEWVERQRKVFGNNETLWRRYILGDWTVVYDTDAWTLFDPQWVEEAMVDPSEMPETSEEESDNEQYWVGVDIARKKDKTVIAIMRGNRLIELQSYKNVSINDIVDLIKKLVQERGIPPENIGLDVIGVGAGVYDNLEHDNYNVVPFFAGRKPLSNDELNEDLGQEFLRFQNLRAQAYWVLRKKFQDGRIEIQKDIEHLDEFKNELLSVRYKLQGERLVQIEEKEKIRARLGRSPDFLDAFVIANFVRYLSSRVERLVVL